MARIVCISDTHGDHRDLDIPNGDILIHAGDISPVWGSINELPDFNDWLGNLPHKHKIFIAGNHDNEFESRRYVCDQLITNGTYLENSSVIVEGLSIFGSPHTVPFAGAFNTSDGARKNMWKRIPDNTDIVITHGPPATILDKNIYGDSCGDGFLYARIREIMPKLHVFGHIHEDYGFFKSDFGTMFVNASISNGNRLNDPIVIDI